MKKNKNRRIMSRVLGRLAWANFHRVCGENENAYKEVLAAKRCLEEFGCDNVKVGFYAREYYLDFEIYHAGQKYNRYYSVSAGHGYVNGYYVTNRENVNRIIGRLEFEYSCALRREYSDYLAFQRRAGNVLHWTLSQDEFRDYWHNGDIHDIPYDVSIRLWRDLRECASRVVNEAVAYSKAVL